MTVERAREYAQALRELLGLPDAEVEIIVTVREAVSFRDGTLLKITQGD